jgi:hypothetical protein
VAWPRRPLGTCPWLVGLAKRPVILPGERSLLMAQNGFVHQVFQIPLQVRAQQQDRGPVRATRPNRRPRSVPPTASWASISWSISSSRAERARWSFEGMPGRAYRSALLSAPANHLVPCVSQLTGVGSEERGLRCRIGSPRGSEAQRLWNACIASACWRRRLSLAPRTTSGCHAAVVNQRMRV